MDKYDDISGAYNLGADAYITKPYTRNQIIQGLKLVLASRPNLLNDALRAHAVEFLRVCYRLTNRTKDLVGQFAAQEDLALEVCGYTGSAAADLLGVRPSAVYRAAQSGSTARVRWRGCSQSARRKRILGSNVPFDVPFEGGYDLGIQNPA